MESMTINRLPARTWWWLKMNETSPLPLPAASPADISVELPESGAVTAVMQPVLKEKIATGMGEDFDECLKDISAPVRAYRVNAGAKVAVPLRYEALYRGNDARADITELSLDEGSSMTVIMRADAEEGAASRAAWQTKIRLKKNAYLRLIQVQNLTSECDFFNDIGCVAEEGATFELIQVILNGANIYYGCRTELVGKDSTMNADIAYNVSGTSALDMNYIANHIGRRTTSTMNVGGVLAGKGKKIFRGTIDFKNGAKGAVGNEKEDVLLLDEGVSNQTIPLILCAEEDVVGNHGATIGRLDEELLFYLQSRGLALGEIYRMMARARIDAVVRKIGDEETQNVIREAYDTTG